ncbi:two component regulator with propeller domain [Flavobacterium tiangeerense]|uniref:Two component regulator with propeller domain n=1 Tax=Flavobacterium tiangeerense TaxID=459471 RepID=A0ABY3FNM2_9FLAO|nr:two-component regulator propeller domain-containing protein [Flavobacterium tiangeerense]TWI03404.1 two component regulator with propeller domain [Flavobacterium tiangeerense]
MNKKIKLIYLILILTLNFSCVEKKSTEKETNKPELVVTPKTDTLKFTSAIRAIFQDSKGNYWFGSHNEGVSFYNGKSFEYFTTNEGLSDNQIRSIQEDDNGKIWFGTANGISVYDKGKFANYPPKNNNPILDWNETNGDLWFYSWEEDGINRFDGINMNYLIFPKPKNPDKSYGVTGISKDKSGKVWIATYAALFSYDGKRVNIFDTEKLNLKDNELLHIRSVLADSKGRIWIENNGIGVLLMEGNSIINFSEKNNLIHPTSTRRGDKSKPGTLEHAFAIEEDSEGNIWFGDVYNGAWKYDGKTLTNYSVSDKPSKPMIWTIYKDNKNNLLFGMADGNIFKFNGKAFEKRF